MDRGVRNHRFRISWVPKIDWNNHIVPSRGGRMSPCWIVSGTGFIYYNSYNDIIYFSFILHWCLSFFPDSALSSPPTGAG